MSVLDMVTHVLHYGIRISRIYMNEEEILGKAYDASLMKRLLKYLRPYKWHVAMGIVMSIAVSAMEAIRPGSAVSLFQAVTTIHEQTLSFVPKALGIVALLVVLLPWMLRTVLEFTTLMFEKMPQMTR